MTLRHIAIAALALAALPQAALAQSGRITPVVSTTMQRVCQAEMTSTLLVEGGQAVENPQPAVDPSTRSLRVMRTPGGRLFENTVSSLSGDTVLRFNTSPKGEVADAALSGSAIDAYAAASPSADLTTLAFAMADDLPERLLLGQSFAVGDSYYPEALRRTLLDRIISGMGLPFAVDGLIDIRYMGEATHEGRPAWRFAGQLTARGSGQLNGRLVGVDHLTKAEVLHDVETGLVLRYETVADTRVDLDGQPTRHVRTTDAYTCEIVAQ